MKDDNKIIEITLNPSIYYFYWILIGISAFFGQICKIIFRINWKKFGKKSLITGIPFLRTQFFVFPVFLNLLFFLYLIYMFKTNNFLINKYFTLKNFLKKIRFGFLFSNILIFCLFFLLYNFVITPAYKKYQIRISGHITCAIFSGSLLNHLNLLCIEFLLIENNKNENIYYLILVNRFLLLHNVYSLFWSAYLFHTIFEIVVGFIISIFFILFVHFINFDHLMVMLLEFNEDNNQYDKSIIYLSNMGSNIINKKQF
jgi:hypothetical protein